MKKLLKIVLWLVGIVVVLVLLAVVGLKLFFPAEKVKAMAIEKGSAALGREIAVEGLDISLWGGLGVELQNVRVGNPEGMGGPDFLKADNVDLKLQLWPLITGDIRVDRLIIEAPTVHMMKTASGDVNYAFALADSVARPTDEAEVPPEGQAAALAISFDELEIENGTIAFRDDSSSVALDLLGVDLSTSLQYPRESYYESSGRLRADSVKLRLDQVYPTVAFELNYNAGFDSRTGDLSIDRAQVRINDVRFKVAGQVGSLTENPSATLNVQSDQVEVGDLLSLLSEDMRAELADYSLAGLFSFDADISYIDSDREPSLHYTGTASLTDLVVSSRVITGQLRFTRCLLDFKPDNLRLNIEDGSFDGQPFKGHLVVDDFDNPMISGELAGSLDLTLVEPFLPVEPGHDLSGQTDFDLKFSGPVRAPKRLSFSGDLAISSGRCVSGFIPEPIDRFDLDAYFDNRLLNIRALNCRFPSGQLDFTGRMTDLVAFLLADSTSPATVSPTVEATVKGSVDLAMAEPYLPELGNPEVTGDLELDVGFSGAIDDLTSFQSHGTVTVGGASYSDSLLPEPIEHLEASFLLRPDTIEVTAMTARFTSSDISFTGRLIRPFPYFLPILDLDRGELPKPLFLFTLSAHRFDTDRLFPEAVPGSGSDAPATSADSISTVMLPDIEGRGTVHADTVIYCGVEFTDVDGKVRVRDRRIECYDATAKVYTGSVSGRTTIDLSDFNNPRYTGEFAATQIEADDFVSRFSRFGGHLFGKANLNGNYNAHGWEPEAFQNSLVMNGSLDVRDGRLVTSGFVHSALSELASRFGESFAEEQPLKGFTSEIVVKEGRVHTDRIAGSLGDMGDFTVDGSYGLADERLDYVGTIILSEARTSKMGLDKIDRLRLPLKIGGTITSPTVEIDYSSLAKQVGESLLKDAVSEGLDKLKGLIKKNKN